MIVFAWDNKYMDPMQAATAVYNNRRPLPQIPTQGRTKKSNEMHPISALNGPNCTSPRPSRLPPTILNRSPRRSPSPNLNAKRMKTAPLKNLPLLYSHSNQSGDLLSGSRSPTVLVRSFPTPTFLDRRNNFFQIQRGWPPLSLLRSRRKLWKKYWLVINLPTVPESDENVHEIESAKPLRPRPSRKLPLPELPSTPIMRPLSRNQPRAVFEKLPPPPPELDDDTGSESSSSDEDLDAYEFDLSCCSPSFLEDSQDRRSQPPGIRSKPKDSRVMYSNTSVRVANHVEADISTIYEGISRRALARISS